MAATKEDIRRWFERGKEQGATHMIVVCDTYDYEDYPVYVMPGKDVREKVREIEKVRSEGMVIYAPRTIMEVYSLKMDMDMQLNEHRAFHYD